MCIRDSLDARLGPDDLFLHDDGVRKPAHLFLKLAIADTFSGERTKAGTLKKSESLHRYFSNRGQTRFKSILLDSDYPKRDWHEDPEVDVSGDGFWEPVATFGDWDRWFVRDRPGVKLFD